MWNKPHPFCVFLGVEVVADESKHVLRITADTSQADSALDKSAEKLDNIDKTASKTNRTFSSLGSRLSGAFRSSGISDFGSKLSAAAKNANFGTKLATSLKSAGTAAKSIQIPKLDLSGVQKSADSAKKSMQGVADTKISPEQYEAMGKEIDKLTAKIAGYEARQKKLKALSDVTQTDKWRKLQQQIDAATESADALWQKQKQMEQSGDAYDSGYKTVAEYAAKAEKSLADMVRKAKDMQASGNTMSKEWTDLQSDIARVSSAVKSYKSQLKTAEQSGTAYTSAYTDTQRDVQAAASAVDQLIAKQNELRSSGVVENSAQWRSLQYDIDAAKAKVEQYKAAMASAGNIQADAPSIDTSDIGSISKKFGSIKSVLKSVGSAGVSAFGSIAKAGLKSAANVAKSFGGKVLGGVKKLGSGLLGAAKSFLSTKSAAGQTDSVINKAYKTFAGFFSMLKSRAKEAAITAIWQSMQESVGSIAGVSDRFNSSISGMIDSVKAFGAQLVAIAEPIISVVGPILSNIMDMMTSAADKLAQFTARLTGKQTYVQASKGQSDYAASVADTTKKTKKAEEEAKKYQRTLLGFDQINKMDAPQQDTSKSAESSESPIGISPAQMQMAETQSSKLNDIADKIFNAFKNKDFAGAGAAVGEAVNEAFSWLKNAAGWEANSEKITSAISGVVDFINGLAGSIDGELIGNAIGDVINSIIHSFDMLFDPETGIDFALIGSKIGDMLKSALDTIDWETAGRAFMNALQALVRLLNSIMATDGIWTSLGTAFLDVFRGIFDAFDPQLFGDSLSNFVNGVADFMIALFGDPKPFADIGKKIAEGINDAISKIDAEKVINAIESFCNSIFSAIWNGLSNLDWAALGNLLWDIISKLGSDLWDWLVGIFSGGSSGGSRSVSTNRSKTRSAVAPQMAKSTITYAGAFAKGGVVGDGQLFLANENGAELIGSDGRGNTAVVNNSQIISAVVSGVKQAMTEVMLMTQKTGDASGGDIVLMVDSEEIARASMRGQRKIDKRYNPSVSFA